MWYGFKMAVDGVTVEGPNVGQPFKAGTWVTWQGQVVVTNSIEDARKFCPPGAKIELLGDLPPGRIAVEDILAKERFGEHSLH